jgi:hypothetical protein
MNLFDGYKTIGDVVNDAMTKSKGVKVQYAIITVIDFLVNEKGKVKLSDSPQVLEEYLDPNYKHYDYVNKRIGEYIERRKHDENWLCYGYYE